MAKPPPGAMSSPYGENAESGDSLSDLIKKTDFFKDAQFNTERKRPDAPVFGQPQPQQQLKTSAQQTSPAAVNCFSMEDRKDIINILMSHNVEAVNMTESDIVFKYKSKLYKVTAL